MTTLTTTNHPSTSVSHYYVSPPQAAPAEMEVVLPPPPAQQATTNIPSTQHHQDPGTQYQNKTWEMTVLHQSEPSPQTRKIPTLQSSSSISHSTPPQPPPKPTTQVQINHPVVDKAYQQELLHRVTARNAPSPFTNNIQIQPLHNPSRHTDVGSQWSLGDHDHYGDPDEEIEDEEEDYGERRSLHRKHSFDGLDY
uniref:Uncharacterized protein n=1 Tax=Lepeophtheirus salmonis TaxID=72036 RepID=A0A0K2U9Q4_LEPSM